MPHLRKCTTCIRGCGFKPPPPEDILAWRQSVVDYVKDPQADRLDLQGVFWDGVLWDETDFQSIFGSLVGSEITELSLERNTLTDKLQKLCEVLRKTKVEKLNLSDCKLTADDLMSLMPVLKDTRIIELDISKNSIQLEKGHQIKRFIACLVSSRVRALNLSQNSILKFEKMSVLFQRLPDTKITRLNLSGCFRSEYCQKHKESLIALMSCLQSTAIIDLNLGMNDLGDDLIEALSPVIGKSKLEKLDLRENKITDAGLDCLAQALVNSRITHLNLYGNNIIGNNNLGRCLKDTKITELELSNNSICNKKIFSGPFLQGSTVRTLKLYYSFCDSFKTIPLHIKTLKYSELTCLDLTACRLQFEHISALADVLTSSKITHINLHLNWVSKDSLEAIGDCLLKSKLKYINLRVIGGYACADAIPSFIEKTKGSTLLSCILCDDSIGHCIDVLASSLANTPLLKLDLSRTGLTCIDPLAQQLKFTAITALHLHRNDIKDKGVVVLSECLEETQIVILDLSWNAITKVGAKALAAVLQNTKLRYLDLINNEIDFEGMQSLVEGAKNSCITCLSLDHWPRVKALSIRALVDPVIWENRKRIKIFAELLRQTALFTGDSSIFEFDRDFENVDIHVFIEGCLKLYKLVSDEPFVVRAIEQDKSISDLSDSYLFGFNLCPADDPKVTRDIFIEDCALIYQNVMNQPSPSQNTTQQGNNSFFTKQLLWLILEDFPKKLVSFIGRAVADDVEQQISLLRKVDELGLTKIAELLLLNRSMYVIDKNQNILHPSVYILLHKYKQPLCNVEVEPTGVERIVGYFTNHAELDGASEVVSLLSDMKLT